MPPKRPDAIASCCSTPTTGLRGQLPPEGGAETTRPRTGFRSLRQMPFEPQWAKIPLRVRWAVSFLVAIALVVLLVRFVDANNSNALAHVSQKNLDTENRQAEIVVGQEQAPVTTAVPAGKPVTQTLRAAVRRDMNHQITDATIDGSLQRVSCVVHGGTLQRTGYHCVAEASDVNYFFLAVFTPKAHRAVFCEKIYPPIPSENVPVSARCNASSKLS